MSDQGPPNIDIEKITAEAISAVDELARAEELEKPATRGELLRALRTIYIAQLAQAHFNASIWAGEHETARDAGIRAVETASALIDLTKEFIQSWINEHE